MIARRPRIREIDLIFARRGGAVPLEEVQRVLDLREKERLEQRHYLDRLRRSLRRAFGNFCWLCGSRRRLQFAHLHPNGLHGPGRGQKNRLLDIARHPFNYLLLCVRCHRQFDAEEPEGARGVFWYSGQRGSRPAEEDPVGATA